MVNNISIGLVTCSFQQANYLERTIRSILDQNYPNLEYVILDGGSTDGSVDIIRKYADRLAYWHSQKDAGQSDAINQGLRRLSTDVVGWLNSDDTLAPDSLQRMASAYFNHPTVDLVYGNTWLIDSSDRVLRRLIAIPTNASELIRYSPNLWSQPGTTWRRGLHGRIGYLDQSLHYAMDCDFWIRAARSGKLMHLPAHLGNLRMHEDTKTSTLQPVRDKDHAELALRYGRPAPPDSWSARVFKLRRLGRILMCPRNWTYRLGFGTS